MARQKVTAETLGSAINEILDDYANGVYDSMQEVVHEAGKKGAQAIKNKANAIFVDHHGANGRYGSGWKVVDDKGRLSARSIIYNEKFPGLPHLLEYGHLNRDGSRTPGREHIQPVVDTLERELFENLERVLK